MTPRTSTKGRAVHFGAGNIGRGFLGQLYFEAGFETLFVDVDQHLVQALHERRGYPLRLVDDDRHTDLTIEQVDAVHGADTEAVAAAVAAADIASTAVGGHVLSRIAQNFANGILLRQARNPAPLDVLLCENLVDAGPHFSRLVRECLPESCHPYFDAEIGFVEASIGRMVPAMTAGMSAEDPLIVCAEPYCELPVDAEAFRAPIPPIPHLQPKAAFKAYVARKIYVHNMSHAATAYLGHAKGHELISEAIRDNDIRRVAEDAAWESCRALSAHYGLDLDELDRHRQDLVRRYHNRALGDRIDRVAKDPIRKLGVRDRLVGAGLLCHQEGIKPDNIAFAAAAAIRYHEPGDPASCQIRAICESHGVEGVLREVCSLEPGAPLAKLIARHYRHWPWPAPSPSPT